MAKIPVDCAGLDVPDLILEDFSKEFKETLDKEILKNINVHRNFFEMAFTSSHPDNSIDYSDVKNAYLDVQKHVNKAAKLLKQIANGNLKSQANYKFGSISKRKHTEDATKGIGLNEASSILRDIGFIARDTAATLEEVKYETKPSPNTIWGFNDFIFNLIHEFENMGGSIKIGALSSTKFDAESGNAFKTSKFISFATECLQKLPKVMLQSVNGYQLSVRIDNLVRKYRNQQKK